MYGIRNEKPSVLSVANDERVLTIRAVKGSGEKPRYVTVQKHSDNWLGLISNAALRCLVEDAEDKMLLEGIRAGGVINAQWQTVDSFNAWILAQSESNRLSKEAIGKWFIADMVPHLMDALLAKGMAGDKIAATCKAYQTQFENVAGRSGISEAIKEQLTKCLALLPEDYSDESGIAEKIATKLSEAETPTDMLDAL